MHTFFTWALLQNFLQHKLILTQFKTAKWLYIEGYLSTSDTARAAVKQAREIAKANQVKIALTLSDPAMVQYARAGLDELVDDGVDLLFCNQQEAMMYTGTETAEAALEQLKTKKQIHCHYIERTRCPNL